MIWLLAGLKETGFKTKTWINLLDKRLSGTLNSDLDAFDAWKSSTRRGAFGSFETDDAAAKHVAIPSLNLGEKYTLSAWVRSDNTSGIRSIIRNESGDAGMYQWSNGTLVGYGGGLPVNTNVSIVAGRWYHIVMTSDGFDKVVYLDGERKDSAVRSFAFDANAKIGNDSFNQDWVGGLDDIRIWNRPLSVSEIKQVYFDSVNGYKTTIVNDFIAPAITSVLGVDTNLLSKSKLDASSMMMLNTSSIFASKTKTNSNITIDRNYQNLRIPRKTINWKQPLSGSSLHKDLKCWWIAGPKSVGSQTKTWHDLVSGKKASLIDMDETSSWSANSHSKIVGSIGFDANLAQEYVYLGQDLIGWTNNEEITVSCWFKTDATTGGVILGVQDNGNTPTTASGWVPAVVVNSNGQVGISLFWHLTSSHLLSTNTYNDGKWHHIVGICANSGASDIERLYIDGKFISSRIVSNNASFAAQYHYYFGSGFSSSWPDLPTVGWFDGQLNDLRMWERALSPQEIYEVYRDSLNNYEKTINRTVKPYSIYIHEFLPKGTAQVGTSLFADISLSSSTPVVGVRRHVKKGINWQQPVKKSGLNKDLISWHLSGYKSTGFKTNKWYDMMDNYHGTLNGMSPSIAWRGAKDGRKAGLEFDGVDDYVKINTGTICSKLNKCTVSIWFRTTNLNQTFGWCLYEERASTGNDLFSLFYGDTTSSGEPFFVWRNDSAGSLSYTRLGTVPAGNDDKWHHAVIVVDGSNTKIYYDAIYSATGTISAKTFTNAGIECRIGGDITDANSNWEGGLDDLRIWKRALSEGEVRQLYYSSPHNQNTLNQETTQLLKFGGYTAYYGARIHHNKIISWRNSPLKKSSLHRKLVAWYLAGRKETGFKTNTWYNLVEDGKDGTLNNMSPSVDWVGSTRVGGEGAIDLDGNNDAINCGRGPSINNMVENDFTASVWINTRTSGSLQRIISKRSVVSGNGWNYFITTDDKIQLTTVNGGAADAIYVGNTVLSTNKWYHVTLVWTFSSRSAKIYINGIEDTYTTQTPGVDSVFDDSDNDMFLGKDGWSSSNFFNGQMDDVRLWRRALSDAEVLSIYKDATKGYKDTVNQDNTQLMMFNNVPANGDLLSGSQIVANYSLNISSISELLSRGNIFGDITVTASSSSFFRRFLTKTIDWQNPVKKSSLNKNLVGWWLAGHKQTGFNTNKWYDLVGKNHGTLTGMDPPSDWVGPLGRPGGFGSLDFDGTDDYVDCGLSTSVSYTGLTMAFWAYRSSSSVNLTAGWGDTVGDRFTVLVWTDGKIYWQTENAGQSFPDTSFSGTGWHHFCLVFSGGTARNGYVDGVDQAVGAGTNIATYDSTGSFRIGTEQANSRYSTGKFDDVRLWNRALSAQEVSAIYEDSLQGYKKTLNYKYQMLMFASVEELIAAYTGPVNFDIFTPRVIGIY